MSQKDEATKTVKTKDAELTAMGVIIKAMGKLQTDAGDKGVQNVRSWFNSRYYVSAPDQW